jgi:hypothetical protein
MFKAAFIMGLHANPYGSLYYLGVVTLPELQGRAGTYQPQPSGYQAFIPAPLPPRPSVNLSGDLQRHLSRADLALGRLDGSIQTLPNPNLFVFMYVRKEAVLSSQIEGTKARCRICSRPKLSSTRQERPGMWPRWSNDQDRPRSRAV